MVLASLLQPAPGSPMARDQPGGDRGRLRRGQNWAGTTSGWCRPRAGWAAMTSSGGRRLRAQELALEKQGLDREAARLAQQQAAQASTSPTKSRAAHSRTKTHRADRRDGFPGSYASLCRCLRNAATDGVGFEPTSRFRDCRFSRPVHSTALPPIRSVTRPPERTAWIGESTGSRDAHRRRWRVGTGPGPAPVRRL